MLFNKSKQQLLCGCEPAFAINASVLHEHHGYHLDSQIYNQSQYSKRSVHKAILSGARSLVFYDRNHRMLPPNIEPQCHKMHITVNNKFDASTTGSRKKRPTIAASLSGTLPSTSGVNRKSN